MPFEIIGFMLQLTSISPSYICLSSQNFSSSLTRRKIYINPWWKLCREKKMETSGLFFKKKTQVQPPYPNIEMLGFKEGKLWLYRYCKTLLESGQPGRKKERNRSSCYVRGFLLTQSRIQVNNLSSQMHNYSCPHKNICPFLEKCYLAENNSSRKITVV